jgi:hypothetical protein
MSNEIEQATMVYEFIDGEDTHLVPIENHVNHAHSLHSACPCKPHIDTFANKNGYLFHHKVI